MEDKWLVRSGRTIRSVSLAFSHTHIDLEFRNKSNFIRILPLPSRQSILAIKPPAVSVPVYIHTPELKGKVGRQRVDRSCCSEWPERYYYGTRGVDDGCTIFTTSDGGGGRRRLTTSTAYDYYVHVTRSGLQQNEKVQKFEKANITGRPMTRYHGGGWRCC